MDLALVIAMIYPVYVLQAFLYFVGLSRRGPDFLDPSGSATASGG